MKRYVWRACSESTTSDQHWQDKLGFSIQWFFEQFAFVKSITDQPSITQSWRSVLNFNFSVLTFWGKRAAWWALSKTCVKWKYFNSNVERNQMTLKMTRSYGSVVKASCNKSGGMGLIPAECWNSWVPLCYFGWHWAGQCTDTRALYRCALHIFFFIEFRQWRSRAYRVLTLNMNIRLPLFWSTSSWTRGLESATCAGLALGRDCSTCRASEQKSQRSLAILFPWNVENIWKTMAHCEEFSNLNPLVPPDCWHSLALRLCWLVKPVLSDSALKETIKGRGTIAGRNLETTWEGDIKQTI